MNSYDRFEQLKTAANVTSYQVSKATGIGQPRLSQWKTKGFTPKYEKLKKIADFFGVSVDVFYHDEV